MESCFCDGAVPSAMTCKFWAMFILHALKRSSTFHLAAFAAAIYVCMDIVQFYDGSKSANLPDMASTVTVKTVIRGFTYPHAPHSRTIL